jgi:hypothetical protein
MNLVLLSEYLLNIREFRVTADCSPHSGSLFPGRSLFGVCGGHGGIPARGGFSTGILEIQGSVPIFVSVGGMGECSSTATAAVLRSKPPHRITEAAEGPPASGWGATASPAAQSSPAAPPRQSAESGEGSTAAMAAAKVAQAPFLGPFGAEGAAPL